MKNKFYASLFIGIGLTLATTPSLAKAAQSPKKQASSSAKPAKTTAHNVASSKKPESKKTSSNKPSESKTHSIANAKDSKHDKSKSHSIADAKDSKHDKSKSHSIADAKDSKHDKSKSHSIANAKDSKHGKSKSQQLADAKERKHYRKNAHQAAEESYEEENEDASTAVEDESQQASDNTSADTAIEPTHSDELAIDTHYGEENLPLIAAPSKPSNLFFPPIDKSNAAQNRTNANELPLPQAVDHHENENSPLISAPTKTNQTTANNDRVHTLITNDSSHQVITSNNEEDSENSESKEQDDSLIQPTNNKRIHSSITRGNSNNFIDNATAHDETSSHVASTHGVVETSLASAGEKAGLSDDMVIELTDIFAWDIDFANNLQSGDQFTVVYEETGTGKANNQIVAAQFINRGKTYTAMRYKDKEGIVSYYTPEGRSLRKAFLSTPVDFAKVSSHFSTHRKHPILNRIRAHKGVDYAARTGTPVKAAGDGVITFHGTKGGYGNMIVISHGEHYETAYAHLSNFRKDLQDGEPVKQGELIGYVGQTGLATGPHLHYEFRVDGVHRDPENLDSKQAMRLAHEEWQNFHAQTIPVLTQLNAAKANTLFAKNP